MGIQRSRIQMGVHAGPEEALAEERAFRARWDAWHAGAEQTIDAAESALHPLLAADAQYVRASVMSAYLVQLRAFSRMEAGTTPQDFDTLARSAMGDADAAMRIYQAGGCLESEIRSRLMLADLYEIAGQPDAAKAIALGVSRVAGAMGYTNLVRRTEEHLAGTTLLNRLDHDLERGGPGEDDIDLAGLTDYRDEPEHLCICTLHRYRSPSGGTDWFGLIEAFKTRFCHGCGDRSPGGSGA